MNGLLELLTNKHWMIHPDFVQASRPMIQQNLNGHAALAVEKKVMATAIPVANGDNPADIFQDSRISIVNGRPVYSWDDEHKDDPFINLMYVDGPITRNGGACTYGSVELRDIMMRAADDEHCVGHIFFINTPGGSAWAKNDFQQAIDYAHSKKQPVNAFIDGMCCSAGMYLASMCDERYYMHPKDQIGCIGVMAAFYTEADGSKNEYTNETYHELYDPESFDKNREMRDIANDGKDGLLIEELTKLGVEFRADIQKACPKVKDEHLHGKVFDAEQVKGILMDGQANLSEVFDLTVKMGKRNGVAALATANSSITLNTINMKEKFPFIAALVDVEEMVLAKDGTHFDMERLETLNAAIETLQKESAQAKELAESLTKQVDELKAAHATVIEEKDNQISALEQEKADLQNDVEGKASQIETLTADLNGAKDLLTTAEGTVAERDQQISDLNAQIEELQNDPGTQPVAGASPVNNGEGLESPTIETITKVAEPGMTYDQMLAKWDE